MPLFPGALIIATTAWQEIYWLTKECTELSCQACNQDSWPDHKVLTSLHQRPLCFGVDLKTLLITFKTFCGLDLWKKESLLRSGPQIQYNHYFFLFFFLVFSVLHFAFVLHFYSASLEHGGVTRDKVIPPQSNDQLTPHPFLCTWIHTHQGKISRQWFMCCTCLPSGNGCHREPPPFSFSLSHVVTTSPTSQHGDEHRVQPWFEQYRRDYRAAESCLTQLNPHVRELGWTHNTKVLSCPFLSMRYGFIILSIFNDINALKRLHCHSPEA